MGRPHPAALARSIRPRVPDASLPMTIVLAARALVDPKPGSARRREYQERDRCESPSA